MANAQSVSNPKQVLRMLSTSNSMDKTYRDVHSQLMFRVQLNLALIYRNLNW